MTKPVHFPKIFLKHVCGRVTASVGIVMKSIMQGNCVRHYDEYMDDPSRKCGVDPRRLQIRREALLQALSEWAETVSMEIIATSLPNLTCHSQGKVHIGFLLRCHSATEEEAREAVITKYLALKPLLTAFIPELEFAPIVEDEEYFRHDLCDYATHAVAVHRRVRQLDLSEPYRKRTVGLQIHASKQDADKVTIDHCFPWEPSLDDWSRLIETMTHQLDATQLTVRIKPAILSAGQKRDLEKNLLCCEQFLAVGEPYQLALTKRVGLIRDAILENLTELTKASFNVGVYLLAAHSLDVSLGHVIGRAITGASDFKEDSLFKGDYCVTQVRAEDVLVTDYYYERNVFSCAETAAAFRFPSPPIEECTGLPIKRFRTGLALTSFYKAGQEHTIEYFLNEHRHAVHPITLGANDRMRHTFIVGQTGTGKSTLMESMILQDIKAGQGVAVIDPHGDLIDEVLGKIPTHRTEDVILFDVLDRERPLGFNILEWSTIDERDLIIDELYTVIDHIYDMRLTGGPIFESNLRSMLKLLMGDRRHDDYTPTILDFIRCYTNTEFRNWLKSRIEDPSVIMDFIRELESAGGDASIRNISPYITSKFGRFTNDTTLMRIVGQEKTTFNFEEIMNQGKIFLVKLGKGRFGASVSALLANMLVSRFKYTAMQRGNFPASQRRDFYLYVDECHNLPSENFMELLAEARKFRMALVLATQYTAQLSSKGVRNDFLSAVVGNVGTIITFRAGMEDAKTIASTFLPCFNAFDIMGLPNWQGYARLQQRGDVIPPFSFRTQKNQTAYNPERADTLRELSRRRYGRDKQAVDTRIREQKNIWQKTGETKHSNEAGDDKTKRP
ncbi:MAG: type IV secretion system DNA-binding domain-containing protein [Deltaproteobacteria bacterium]|nr:type IV secretion system DNA-binding domain-containing protein [Deltaproteobacteria bacterium]